MLTSLSPQPSHNLSPRPILKSPSKANISLRALLDQSLTSKSVSWSSSKAICTYLPELESSDTESTTDAENAKGVDGSDEELGGEWNGYKCVEERVAERPKNLEVDSVDSLICGTLTNGFWDSCSGFSSKKPWFSSGWESNDEGNEHKKPASPWSQPRRGSPPPKSFTDVQMLSFTGRSPLTTRHLSTPPCARLTSASLNAIYEEETELSNNKSEPLTEKETATRHPRIARPRFIVEWDDDSSDDGDDESDGDQFVPSPSFVSPDLPSIDSKPTHSTLQRSHNSTSLSSAFSQPLQATRAPNISILSNVPTPVTPPRTCASGEVLSTILEEDDEEEEHKDGFAARSLIEQWHQSRSLMAELERMRQGASTPIPWMDDDSESDSDLMF